jgi:hypothetical protein
MLRGFRSQQSFQLTMAHDQAHHLRARRLHDTLTQSHVVPQVVDADRQALESDRGRGCAHFRQRQFFWRSA